MAKTTHHIKQILVYADWIDLGGAILMGTLQAERKSVSHWQEIAARMGIPRGEVQSMESAFAGAK